MKRKLFLVFLLVFMLLVALMIGCTNQGKEGSQKDINSANQISKNKNAPEKLQNPNITIMSHHEVIDALAKSFSIFEEKYGAKVNYMLTPNAEKTPKLISMVTAGDPPDVVNLGAANMPSYAIQGLIQPVDSLIDIDDPVWIKRAMQKLKYKGNIYGITRDIAVHFIFYNKSLFENNGIRTPLEYYKEGKWNFNTLKEVAMQLTQDIDRDGTIDQWGFAPGGKWDVIAYANGTQYVNYRDDGTIELNLKDPKMIEALQFFQDGLVKDKFIDPQFSGETERFVSGKVAMIIDKKMSAPKYLDRMKYDWDLVPFPQGPSASEEMQPAGSGGWAVPVGAKNPEGAIAWAYIYQKIAKEEEDQIYSQKYTQEQFDRILKAEENIVLFNHEGVGDFKKKLNQNILNQLKNNMPLVTAIEQSIPIFEGEISKVVSGK